MQNQSKIPKTTRIPLTAEDVSRLSELLGVGRAPDFTPPYEDKAVVQANRRRSSEQHDANDCEMCNYSTVGLPSVGIFQLGNVACGFFLVSYDTYARANDGALDATPVGKHFSGGAAYCAA